MIVVHVSNKALIHAKEESTRQQKMRERKRRRRGREREREREREFERPTERKNILNFNK